jgi:broad specificity phosphatase PhoE
VSPEIVLVRHGETEWSRDGRHSGRADIPLTERGRRQARAVGVSLADRHFTLVSTSPLQRASETCRLAGYGDVATVLDDLQEWDDGDNVGKTTSEIRKARPDWSVWRDGAPNGEAPADVGARADRVLAELDAAGGDVLVFSHGHFLRVLAARWLGFEPAAGRLFVLDAGAISILGYERETRVLRLWNESP